jgi:hypothetical protein
LAAALAVSRGRDAVPVPPLALLLEDDELELLELLDEFELLLDELEDDVVPLQLAAAALPLIAM